MPCRTCGNIRSDADSCESGNLTHGFTKKIESTLPFSESNFKDHLNLWEVLVQMEFISSVGLTIRGPFNVRLAVSQVPPPGIAPFHRHPPPIISIEIRFPTSSALSASLHLPLSEIFRFCRFVIIANVGQIESRQIDGCFPDPSFFETSVFVE